MKTIVFTMFSAHPGTGCGCDFQPRITQKTILEPMLQSSANKSAKKHKTYSKLDPKRTPEPMKKSYKSKSAPQGVLSGVPLDPRITKMVSQVSRMEP